MSAQNREDYLTTRKKRRGAVAVSNSPLGFLSSGAVRTVQQYGADTVDGLKTERLVGIVGFAEYFVD